MKSVWFLTTSLSLGGVGYVIANSWVNYSVKHELEWQKFELETLNSQSLWHLRDYYKDEILGRDQYVGELQEWLNQPIWKRWEALPPKNKYTEYL